jgi:ATP-dependent RNA helicase RhlE
MSFSTLGLTPALLKTIANQNITAPYPIQVEAIPAILSHKDVLGIAPTGSGKTASYVWPILSNLQKEKELKNRHIQVLVLVPTRELAIQVSDVFLSYTQGLPKRVKVMAVYGGVSINPQMIALQGVNVLVATPGRLLELIENKAVHLTDVETLVLDEADKMLNLGFKEEMNRIFNLLPKKRQNLLFSATLNVDVSLIRQMILDEPVIIKIQKEVIDNFDLISQLAYFVTEERKGPLLRYLIKTKDMKQVLVFASSVFRADSIADKLRKNGIKASAIHSKKSQGARKAALNDFKSGAIQVLVATDLMSRGIDIEFLPYVINYELPRSPKDYIHRIGRTGRAETPGEALSFIAAEEEHHFKVIQKKMGKPILRVSTEELDLKGF